MNIQGDLRHGGLVVLPRVAGLVGGLTHPDGSTAWSGSFLIKPGRHLIGRDYTLCLDDGTSHGIRLRGVTAGPSLAANVPFVVCGTW